MFRQYKQIWTAKNAKTMELLREENVPKTPLDILIEREEADFDVVRKKQKYIAKQIKRNLSRLTFRQRQLINLYFIKGKTQQEIAQQLGLSRPNVTITLKLAKKNLKNFLQNDLHLL